MFWVIFWWVLGILGFIMAIYISGKSSSFLIWFPIIIAGVIWFLGCIGEAQKAQAEYEKLRTPETILFAGKIINSETGKWPNNRLVLLYLHGEEIGRAISATGELPENELGVQDGLFVITISNTYKLVPSDFKIEEGAELSSGVSLTGLYTWFELEEGKEVEIDIPSKNFTYIIKSIAGDKSTLPSELLTTNSTRLTDDNEVVVSLSNDNTNVPQNFSPENNPTIGDLQYTDIQTKTVILRKLSHPVKNCVSARLTTVFSDTRTVAHQYQVEIGGEIGAEVTLPIPVIQVQLFAALQAKYGFEQGQLETRTIAYRIEAEPHTNQVYDFSWKEVWEYGTAQTVNGEINIPFEVKTDLVYDVDSRDLGCN